MRPRCCARSVAYPGASLKGQCGRPSLSRRPVHQSLYRARERRESRVPFGPHPLRGYKALDSRHSLAVWPSKKPAASPVLAGPGASPAKVETPEPLAKASTIEIHRPPLRARLAPTLWKNPGEGRRLKEVDSWIERPALLRDLWLRGFSHIPRPGRELVPANKSESWARLGRFWAPVIRWQDHGYSFPLVSNSLNTKFFFQIQRRIRLKSRGHLGSQGAVCGAGRGGRPSGYGARREPGPAPGKRPLRGPFRSGF